MSSVDTNSWQSMFPKAQKDQRVFVTQLVRHLSESFSPGGLAASLSGSNHGVAAGALTNFSQDYSGGSSQTANVANAYAVHVSWSIGGFPATLTLSNLSIGSPVTLQIENGTGSNGTLKFAATNGSGVAYTIFAKTAGLYVNMVTVGVNIATGATLVFNGNSSMKCSTPDLELVYN
jgi:hypothetical protein